MSYNSGIYKITNITNNKVYFGSSIELERRWKNGHLDQLRANKHGNDHLQKAFNKHGEASFKFEIVMYCSPNDCLFYEQRFLDAYWDGGINCYNIAKNAQAARTGIPHTEETKLKIKIASSNPTQETRDKKSKSHTGLKQTEEHNNNISNGLKLYWQRKHNEIKKSA